MAGCSFFVAGQELEQLVLVEIIGPVGGIGPAADYGELQYAVGQVDYGRSDAYRIEIEHDRDLLPGKEHIARMPVAVDDLLRPRIEAEPVDADARFVVENCQVLGGFLYPRLRGGDVIPAKAGIAAGPGRSVGADGPQVGADDGRVVEAGLERLEFVCEIGEVAVEFGQLQAGVDCGLRRAVVARAGDEFEKLVDVVVQLEDCVVVAAGGQQGRDGEGLLGEVGLDGVGEGDAVEVVLASRAALEQELALVGDDDHFWGAAVAAGQRLDLVNDADVVMAEDAYQLFGRKMCSASGHKDH